MNSFHKKFQFLTLFTVTALLFLSCSKDDEIDSDGPVAQFTHSAEDLTASFVNNSEGATSFVWEFGDGTISSEIHPVHIYDEAGTYTVMLTAREEGGVKSEASQEVTVTPPDPVAFFTFDVNYLNSSFMSTSRDAASYLWNFGDGTTSTEEHPTHRYTAEGTYTVALTTTSKDGARSTVKKELNAREPIPEENILRGGDMRDRLAWTVQDSVSGVPATSINLITTDEGEKLLRIFAEGEAVGLVWQRVEIPVAGTYKFSADVTSTGAEDLQFEAFFGAFEPTQYSTYTNGLYAGIDTSEGCGAGEFAGNLVELACTGPGVEQEGLVTFDEPKIIYLVMQVGSSSDLGTLTIDNIELTFVEGID